MNLSFRRPQNPHRPALRASAAARPALLLAAATGFVAATSLALPVAQACGGFFCNTSAPVDQAGEQILFSVQDGLVEAIVAVEYQGPSEDFAWIVPTPSLPEVGVSSEAVFNRLAQYLAPRFVLNWTYEGDCMQPPMAGGDGGFQDASSAVDTASDAGGVEVVLQDQVGPYDYAILRATDSATLFDWLQTNNYDIPDNVQPFVDPYVLMGEDIHFVAFKLTKGNDSGDVTPIVLRYQADNPTIPIQLTAVAVQPDMPVVAYVLGDSRAVPENYLHVEINLARINWLSGGSNYRDVVAQAMNEAGGKAFATDYAGATSLLDNVFFLDGRFSEANLAAAGDPQSFFWELQNQGFMGEPALLGLFEQFVPMPDELAAQGLRPQDFYNCLSCYSDYWPTPFDAAGFAAAVRERIVEPLRHVQELTDALPYITRLYSALSAEEMTLDPTFVFNPDLGDVNNVHTADAIVRCEGGYSWESPVTIRLADGRSMIVRQDGSDPYNGLAAAAVVQETGAAGAPMVVADNRAEIDRGITAVIAEQGFEVTENPTPDLPLDPSFTPRKADSSGCTAGSATTRTGLLGLLGLVGLLNLRRRRSTNR